ncbi:MAG: hypothetical protein LBC37_02985 [Zoogloeaceae bacterium]|nr:hypothetical protein [Zoogloeaceae bacterium]
MFPSWAGVLAILLCFALPAGAAEDDYGKEMKEIRAGQAREKARVEEAKRLTKQSPGKAPPPAASGLPERDPFEASPTLLSEGEANKRRVNLRTPDNAIFRSLILKALVRASGGGVAQVQNGRDLITLYHGDEITLEGRRYKVEILSDGVKFQEQIPENVEVEAGAEGGVPRQLHTGWVR